MRKYLPSVYQNQICIIMFIILCKFVFANKASYKVVVNNRKHKSYVLHTSFSFSGSVMCTVSRRLNINKMKIMHAIIHLLLASNSFRSKAYLLSCSSLCVRECEWNSKQIIGTQTMIWVIKNILL